MPRISKISAYLLALIALGTAIYSLVGISRDLSGEKCYGFWGIDESCLSAMMIPVQLGLPFAIPVILLLILLIIIPLIRKKTKK